jgi:hypothetical protein
MKTQSPSQFVAREPQNCASSGSRREVAIHRTAAERHGTARPDSRFLQISSINVVLAMLVESFHESSMDRALAA